jgi:hypothetical protein
MSTTKQTAHTPGPWETRGNGHNRTDIWQAEEAGNQQIGEVYTGGANKNNAGYANARLIAAAPELLEALEEAAKTLADLSEGAANQVSFAPAIDLTAYLKKLRDHGRKGLQATRAAIAKAQGN